MASQLEPFFIAYAESLVSNDTDKLAGHHLLPSVFVTDDVKQVCNQRNSLTACNQRLLAGLHSREVSKAIPQVNQAMRLSDSIMFCSVKWQFMGRDESLSFSATCSYTLQKDKNQHLKIIVSVLDDDDKILCEILRGD